MKTCPVCYGPVPFGGGKTTKNARAMFELTQELRARLKPDAAPLSVNFVVLGEDLATSLHEYAHKRSMVNPDWASAGLWTRQATTLVRNLREG